jgi:outer membrane protein assembly factor BamB
MGNPGFRLGVKNMGKRLMLVAVIVMSACCGVRADWPQYLGPNRNSISDQKGILRSWPENGPEVLWTVTVGIGFGGPVVKDGNVYLLDRDDQVGDNLRCFDLSNGKELWNCAYDAPGSVMFPGSRSVPTVQGNNVYSCGHNGDLYCIDINTHKPVWNKNVWTDFGGGRIPMWAITQNPLIYGDLLILASQAPQAGVVAYEKLSGNVKWTTPSLGPVGYVSPSMVKVSGQDHLVMITASSGGFRRSGGPGGRRGPRMGPGPGGTGGPGTGPGPGGPAGSGRGPGGPEASGSGSKVVGIDPLTGKILWEYTNWQCRIPVPSAVDAGEGRVLITGGYNAGAAMIKVEKKPDGSYGVTELYKTVEFGAHTQPPILYNGHFYVQYSTNERKDGMVCMSIDGQIKWETRRSPLFDKGGSILADGLLLSTDGSTTLYLIEPDPSGFKPLASAALLERGQNWAPLALADGKLLIRDQTQIKCVVVR